MIGFLSGNSDFKYEVSEDNSSVRSVITVRYKDDDDWLFDLKGNNEGGATFTLYVYFSQLSVTYSSKKIIFKSYFA